MGVTVFKRWGLNNIRGRVRKEALSTVFWIAEVLFIRSEKCRARVSRNFRIFVLSFVLNFPDSVRSFLDFHALFPRKRRPLKFHQSIPPFFSGKSQANQLKRFTKAFWRGQESRQSTTPLKPPIVTTPFA